MKLIILFLGCFLYFTGWQSVDASENKSLEKSYYDLGYKKIPEAVKDTETYYKNTLELPKKLPQLEFTHSFGRFSSRNETLEIKYLNEKEHFSYIINIIPAKNGSHQKDLFSNYDNKVSLKDGTQAYFSTSGKEGKVIITFMFIKNDWIYMLNIRESLLDDPVSTLTEISNSIDSVK